MSDMGDELFAWQVLEQPDVWSLVGTMIPTEDGNSMHTPLVHRNRDIVENKMGRWARLHAEKTGQKLRFAHFKLVSESDSA